VLHVNTDFEMETVHRAKVAVNGIQYMYVDRMYCKVKRYGHTRISRQTT